jgi:hypothetical protein
MRRGNEKKVLQSLQTEEDEKERKHFLDETVTFHGTPSSGVLRAAFLPLLLIIKTRFREDIRKLLRCKMELISQWIKFIVG